MMRDIQVTTIPEDSREAFVFYAQDWIVSWGVKRMTPAQRGMYIQLIAEAFNNGPLPNDDELLWWLAGARSKKEWDRNKEPVLKQWVLDEMTNTWAYPRLITSDHFDTGSDDEY